MFHLLSLFSHIRKLKRRPRAAGNGMRILRRNYQAPPKRFLKDLFYRQSELYAHSEKTDVLPLKFLKNIEDGNNIISGRAPQKKIVRPLMLHCRARAVPGIDLAVEFRYFLKALRHLLRAASRKIRPPHGF